VRLFYREHREGSTFARSFTRLLSWAGLACLASVGCGTPSLQAHAAGDPDAALARASIEPSPLLPSGPELRAGDGEVGDNFGFSLALSQDTALIGSPGHRVGLQSSQGAAYVFERSASAWTSMDPSLIVADGAQADSFGYALAMSGNTAVVGAPGHRIGARPFQGAVYVFVRSGGRFEQQGDALVASDGQAADAFGSAVAISGNTILVGAPAHDVDSKSDQGAAYVFVQSDAQWTQQGPALTALDGQA
jgi:FG-GAP repeat